MAQVYFENGSERYPGEQHLPIPSTHTHKKRADEVPDMYSIHDLRILRDRMHTGLDERAYGRIALKLQESGVHGDPTASGSQKQESKMGCDIPVLPLSSTDATGHILVE